MRSDGSVEQVEPGQVWWCDGGALAFEAHFKRRPVLVLGVRAEAAAAGEGSTVMIVVAPLSSRRRFGQEQAVTHGGGVSYLTGRIAVVPPESLVKPLGRWEGFDAWSAAQNAPPPPSWLTRLLRRFHRDTPP